MPAKSQAQRAYLNAVMGHAWVKKHGFDNKGHLPGHVKHYKRGGVVSSPVVKNYDSGGVVKKHRTASSPATSAIIRQLLDKYIGPTPTELLDPDFVGSNQIMVAKKGAVVPSYQQGGVIPRASGRLPTAAIGPNSPFKPRQQVNIPGLGPVNLGDFGRGVFERNRRGGFAGPRIDIPVRTQREMNSPELNRHVDVDGHRVQLSAFIPGNPKADPTGGGPLGKFTNKPIVPFMRRPAPGPVSSPTPSPAPSLIPRVAGGTDPAAMPPRPALPPAIQPNLQTSPSGRNDPSFLGFPGSSFPGPGFGGPGISPGISSQGFDPGIGSGPQVFTPTEQNPTGGAPANLFDPSQSSPGLPYDFFGMPSYPGIGQPFVDVGAAPVGDYYGSLAKPFKRGGRVPGMGQPVPAIVHGGEAIFNPRQLKALKINPKLRHYLKPEQIKAIEG